MARLSRKLRRLIDHLVQDTHNCVKSLDAMQTVAHLCKPNESPESLHLQQWWAIRTGLLPVAIHWPKFRQTILNDIEALQSAMLDEASLD